MAESDPPTGNAAHAINPDTSVMLAIQPVVGDALQQLTELWQAFGLNEDEQQHQKKLLVATIKKSCQTRVTSWRREVDRVASRVVDLEAEVQTIKSQFQGNESTGWLIQSLDQLCGGALRDRMAALEMEFKFLDSVRASRLAEVSKLQDQLSMMDRKLGSTSVLPSDASILSESYKANLQEMVKNRSRKVHTQRAALLEAVSECVQLARELQVEPDRTFSPGVNDRLKKRDLSVEMLQKISQRTVELRELKVKRELRMAEMLGQIHELWRELQIPEEERDCFRETVNRAGKAALASYEAELTRLQHHHKRFAATAVQVSKMRDAITEHWDLLGYSPDQRRYFDTMMTTPDSGVSYKIFRAHEKALVSLKRHAFGMRELTSCVAKREDILQARTQYGAPDEKTRLRIERELPKYTTILLNRIAKWESDTGVVFRWKGERYLEQIHADDGTNGIKRMTSQTHNSVVNSKARRTQHTNRHSIEERAPPPIPGMEEQLRRRRSDPQAPERPRWRNFIRSTFLR
ncbi:Microtubule associated protein (MAP65/ASE1 family) [Phytophthora infestans]|uniref:Microtubule associated protein (MAP65/ASE1 family) n=1 Tax=Phytophthora infestans TaxID=4787 RepID=A0A833SFM8_PHYIN|nr:Microtubule associated protein (MAP65/ASE1 family) [Phytophthora infestans]KAF4149251.1 Microtubule associated protein (MAP65/ASE1 family) [Phytophthora infestans]